MEYIKNLIEKAIGVSKDAYSPYSKFNVGAALLTSGGKIYGGFNIENSSYAAALCAERTAIARAAYDGCRDFMAIAVVGGKQDANGVFKSYCPPCGICRQVLREFCNPNEFKIILAKSVEDYKVYTLESLLPESYGPENLL